MIWYRIKITHYSIGTVIEQIEVDRETNKFLIINRQRCRKRTKWDQSFSTHKEAKDTLIKALNIKIKQAEMALRNFKKDLVEVEKLGEDG